LTLSWSEVVAGTTTPVPNPDQLIEPGEGALVHLSIAFDPPVGSPVTYQEPAIGTGTVGGFASVAFSIFNTLALGGTWSHPLPYPGFTAGLGIPLPDGTLGSCTISQPYPAPGSSPIPDNPLINIWGAVWTPSSYQARQVSFRPEPALDSGRPRLFAATGGTLPYGYAYGNTVNVPTQIPIVPAPAAAGPVVLLALASMVRRRRN
jgi:hypothetical protein